MMGSACHYRSVRRGDPCAARRDLHQVEAHRALLAVRRRHSSSPVAVPKKSRPRDAGRAGAHAEGVWTRLNWSWVGFFAFMGAANLLVAYNFPTDTWVNFKLFGGMGLMLVFVVLQALFLARHVEEKDASS